MQLQAERLQSMFAPFGLFREAMTERLTIPRASPNTLLAAATFLELDKIFGEPSQVVTWVGNDPLQA
jgi:hypothetical protein